MVRNLFLQKGRKISSSSHRALGPQEPPTGPQEHAQPSMKPALCISTLHTVLPVFRHIHWSQVTRPLLPQPPKEVFQGQRNIAHSYFQPVADVTSPAAVLQHGDRGTGVQHSPCWQEVRLQTVRPSKQKSKPAGNWVKLESVGESCQTVPKNTAAAGERPPSEGAALLSSNTQPLAPKTCLYFSGPQYFHSPSFLMSEQHILLEKQLGETSHSSSNERNSWSTYSA